MLSYKKSCLIIDDDPEDHEIFMGKLREINHEIDCKAMIDAFEAIDILTFTDYTPDYIFLDVKMPKIDGLECLDKLRSIPRLNHIPIFMISTSAPPKVVETSKIKGANEFFVKPTTVSELDDLLKGVFYGNFKSTGSANRE